MSVFFTIFIGIRIDLLSLPQHCKSRRASESSVKGEAVIYYRNPLTILDLKSSGFPARVNNMVKSIASFEFADGDILKIVVLL